MLNDGVIMCLEPTAVVSFSNRNEIMYIKADKIMFFGKTIVCLKRNDRLVAVYLMKNIEQIYILQKCN